MSREHRKECLNKKGSINDRENWQNEDDKIKMPQERPV